MGVPTSFVPRGLIKRFIVAHCTLIGAPKMASFSTPAAGVWLVPSRHGYKCTFPNYRSSNFLSLQLQPPLQSSTFLIFLPCYFLSNRSLIRSRLTGGPLTRSAQIPNHASTDNLMSATTRSQADPLVPLPPIPTTIDHSNPALRQISLSQSALPQRLKRILGESQVQALKYNNHHKQTHRM